MVGSIDGSNPNDMDGYSNVVRGSLFGKGSITRKKDSKQKKKKKHKDDKKKRKKDRDASSEDENQHNAIDSKRKRCDNLDDNEKFSDDDLAHLTPAQRKFEIARRKREKDTIQKMISKSHREKIDEFNEKLEKLTEHNDIPRIGAAGNG